jgi:hypothetical protein
MHGRGTHVEEHYSGGRQRVLLPRCLAHSRTPVTERLESREHAHNGLHGCGRYADVDNARGLVNDAATTCRNGVTDLSRSDAEKFKSRSSRSIVGSMRADDKRVIVNVRSRRSSAMRAKSARRGLMWPGGRSALHHHSSS